MAPPPSESTTNQDKPTNADNTSDRRDGSAEAESPASVEASGGARRGAAGRSPASQSTAGGHASENPTDKGGTRVELGSINYRLPLGERPAEAMRLAQEAFAQTGYWVAFYRAILGPEGVVAKLFPTDDEQEHFAGTREYTEIQKMLAALRSSDRDKPNLIEPQRMVTVRMPASLQQSLIEEAAQRGVSINKLCISKMLLRTRAEFVPVEPGRVRGRKPRQQ